MRQHVEFWPTWCCSVAMRSQREFGDNLSCTDSPNTPQVTRKGHVDDRGRQASHAVSVSTARLVSNLHCCFVVGTVTTAQLR